MEAEYIGKLNVQAAGESFSCCITGLVLISPQEIVLADYYNNSIKILNTSNNSITSTHKLSGAPWDVTAIKADTAAATLPDKGRIVFMDTRHCLFETQCLRVREGCWGLDYRDGLIAVSFSKPSAVHILDIKGNLLHNFSVQGIYNCQSYVSFSNDNQSIFVSDNENHEIHQLTTDGHEIKELKCGDLKSPAGLTVMRNGTVVVCGIGNSDRVTSITAGSMNFVPVALHDLHKPCCVTVSEEDNKMYIGEDTSSVDRNYIKVYKLKQ